MIEPTYEKDGFLFFKRDKEAENNDCLILDESRIDLIYDYMNNNQLKHVAINTHYFHVTNLDIIRNFTFINTLIIANNHFDITPINELKSLVELRIGDYKGSLDFNNLPCLQILGIAWSTRLKNLQSATTLKWIWLDNFKSDSLDLLKDLNLLKYLSLFKPTIKSLIGIGNISSLEEIYIDTAPFIHSLSGLNANNSNLKVLNIYNALKLTDYTSLGSLISLEKLRITKAGEIPEISFVQKLPNLKEVKLGVRVTDGNMVYLKQVPNFYFKNFPHYNLRSLPYPIQ